MRVSVSNVNVAKMIDGIGTGVKQDLELSIDASAVLQARSIWHYEVKHCRKRDKDIPFRSLRFVWPDSKLAPLVDHRKFVTARTPSHGSSACWIV